MESVMHLSAVRSLRQALTVARFLDGKPRDSIDAFQSGKRGALGGEQEVTHIGHFQRVGSNSREQLGLYPFSPSRLAVA